MIIYADGISIYGQNPDYKKTVRQTNDFVPEVISFLENRQLQVLSDKSTVTLIALFKKYVNDHPQFRIKRSVLPREKKTKVLVIKFESSFSFTHNVSIVADRATKSL